MISKYLPVYYLAIALVSTCFFQNCKNKKDINKGKLIHVNLKEAVTAQEKDFNIDKNNIVLQTAHLKLETCDPQRIIQDGKTILVFDKYAKTVMAFDQTGTFKFIIDHLGQGPGEYNNIDDIGIKKNDIYVADNTLGKIVLYNKEDGKFNTEQKNNIRPINKLVYFNNYFIVKKGVVEHENEKQRHQLFFCNSKMKIKNGQIPYSGGSSIVFSPVNPIQQVGDEISILPTYDQTIYSLNKANELKAKYTIDFGDKNINQEALLNDPKYNKSNDWITKKLGEFPSVVFLNFYENSKYIWYYYDFQLKHYSTIYNKATDKTKTYDLGKYGKESKIMTGLNKMPIGVIDDKFVFSYDSNELPQATAPGVKLTSNSTNNTIPKPMLLLIEPSL